MTFAHVLAVVPVVDITRAREFYTRLFGRAPDNEPMDGLCEWQVTDSGWVQVFVDAERAGSGMLNLASDDLDADIADLAVRSIDAGDIQEAAKGVRVAMVADPYGNRLALIGGFRVDY